MASILQQVGTPLQLIALFLLLVAGIARLMVRSGTWKASPGTTHLVINRFFQVAIVALFVGVAGPAVAPVIDRIINGGNETFHGAVLSTAGEAVPDATVNLLTLATALTNGLGQFDITIPGNRALKEYKPQVTARLQDARRNDQKRCRDEEYRDPAHTGSTSARQTART